MPKLVQKSGLSSNKQFNRTMLQTQAETGELCSVSVGSCWGKPKALGCPAEKPSPREQSLHSCRARENSYTQSPLAIDCTQGTPSVLPSPALFRCVWLLYFIFSGNPKYCITFYITAKRKSTRVTKSHHPKRNAKWSRQ